jgi:hypothetical protein
MKNNISIFLFLVLFAVNCTNSGEHIRFDEETIKNLDKIDSLGFVQDPKTAIKVAEAIWLPIYGKLIYKYKPFVANLKDDKVWIVEGTVKEEKGGGPYMEIQKSDCKVLKVVFGK